MKNKKLIPTKGLTNNEIKEFRNLFYVRANDEQRKQLFTEIVNKYPNLGSFSISDLKQRLLQDAKFVAQDGEAYNLMKSIMAEIDSIVGAM